MSEYDDRGQQIRDPHQQGPRNLTDADIKALGDELESRLANTFYKNLGKGVWAMVWRALVFILVGLASYGAVKGFK